MPPAIDTMSCSAMPHSTKRSGNRFANEISPQSFCNATKSLSSGGITLLTACGTTT